MKMKIENVLIGSSLSEASDDVVRAGLAVARAAGARVHLVNAFLPQAVFGGGAPFAAEVMINEVIRGEQAARRRQLNEQISRLGVTAKELGSWLVEMGASHRVIIDAAKLANADLVVVGATESPVMSKLFGATADRVVRKSTRPALLVRGKLPVPPRRVLFPVDLSPLSRDALRHGLELLGGVVPERNASLEALFVMTMLDRQGLAPDVTPEAAEAEAVERVERFVAQGSAETGWKVESKVVLGYVEEEILARAAELDADLIVIGTHGRGGFERFLLGSVASGVVRHGKQSVLVLPPEAALKEALAHEAEHLLAHA